MLIVGLLAFSLVSGMALPSPWLWQCRHAARLVAGPFATPGGLMPCRMGGTMVPGAMACCRVPRAARLPKSSAQRQSERPFCHPTLVPTASLPVAQISRARLSLRQHLATAFASNLLTTPTPFPWPAIEPQQPRPPPSYSLPGLCRLPTPGPRAPPFA